MFLPRAGISPDTLLVINLPHHRKEFRISNLPYHVIMIQHVTLASWLDDKSGDERAV